MEETTTQVKFFSNASYIVLEDLMNEWSYNHHTFITIVNIIEIQNTDQPTFLLEYVIQTNKVERPKNEFKLVVDINKRKKA